MKVKRNFNLMLPYVGEFMHMHVLKCCT